ncbi:AAA family ATPase [Chloroflexota bacterium]
MRKNEIGAPDDSFKTNWALQLSISLAAGDPCYTYSCKKSEVVYLILEGGTDYIHERLEEKIDVMGLDKNEVMSRIYTSDCSQLQLDNEEVVKQIEKTLLDKNPKPDIVIFDPITYALNEDVRFSPQKSKLCRNLLRIATQINGVVLIVIHCRKDTQDNNSMDDFLGASIIADAVATRIKLYRKGESKLHMYTKTRYAERPEQVSLLWKYPLLKVIPEILKPREEAKKAILEFLQSDKKNDYKVSELMGIIAQKIGHNEKTVRVVLDNLHLEGKINISRLPKSAIKIVKLVDTKVMYTK